MKSLFEGCCQRLRVAGIPLWRSLLAIFPIRNGEAATRETCEAALAAAQEAENRLAKIPLVQSPKRAAAISYGLGLHVRS